jgi:hypothetical protein
MAALMKSQLTVSGPMVLPCRSLASAAGRRPPSGRTIWLIIRTAISKAGKCDALLQAHANDTEIRILSHFGLQPLNQVSHLSSRTIFKLNRAAALAEWRQFGVA